MWNIYGKKYDLSNFAKYHPGGKEIIEKMRDMDDCTALFETYHAFSDIKSIRESLTKYEIRNSDDSVITSHKNHDFTTYHKLIAEIKTVFPDRSSIKAPISWYLWNSISLSTMIFIYYQLMVIQNIYIKWGLALICGIIESSFLYNMLHDGSHYGISIYPTVNNYISRTFSAWELWNHLLWLYHHVYYHHSFTGSQQDPDTLLYIVTYKWMRYNDITHTIGLNILYGVFPGQYFGQFLIYIINSFKLTIVHSDLKIPSITYYDWVAITIMLIKLYCLWLVGLPSILILITQNTLYYTNVFGDHELFETYENHYDGNDWAKRQICNSGNFMNGYWWWAMLFSGINYQIEHHLFPNMSGHKYAKIAPIVQKFCKENNIPYVHKNTFTDTYKSFIKRVLVNK